MFITQKVSNQKIRQNRLKLRQKLKINLANHEKKEIPSQTNNQKNNSQIKTETHVKVLNRIGLVEKQFIQGSFEDSYILKEKIGQGAHATVYRCIEKATLKVFAVKITKHSDQQLVECAKFQYKILKGLNHQNVMKAQAFYTDRVKMTTYLICELFTYPELGVYLRNRKNKFLSESQATVIITQILQTLQYLHKKGICHRDIKPQNILYDSINQKIKLIDFDCAKNRRQYESKFQMWTKTGSIHYQAPQYFQKTVYDEKVDIWAVGVIAYELISGKLPFMSNYSHRIIKMIIQQQLHIEQLQVSEDFKYLLTKLLERDSQKRLTARQCLRLPIILKNQHVYLQKTFDDFDLEISTHESSSPRSCTSIKMRRTKQILTSLRNPENNSILKLYCFVPQISQI